MKKIISSILSLVIVLSLLIVPTVTSATAETIFVDDGVFTFDDASDIYGSWVGGTPAPTVSVTNGSINADFTGQWTYACILMPIKLKAGENYTAKINYNMPVSSKLYVFYTEGLRKIDKTNNVIKQVLNFGSTSGDAETVFSFTATDDTKNILGFYIENCSTEALAAKINSFAIKKTTTGEANLEFDDSTDVAASWKYGTGATVSIATSDDEHSVIAATLPQYTQTRIALPIKLEANKTYKYKVTMRSSDALSNTIIKLFVGSSSSTAIGNPDTAASFVTMVNRGTVAQSYSDYTGEFTVDSANITETDNLFSIYIKNDNATTQTYYVDSIAVSEKRTPSTKAKDTFEFTSLSDVAGTQAGDSYVTVKQDVTNGKICVDFKDAWKNARIALPVKLDKDADYIFTIKYKAPKNSTYYLFAGSEEKPLYPYSAIMTPNKSKIALSTGDSIQEVQFEYKASSGIVTDTYNLLGLYVESSVADAYTLEIYSISYQSQKTVTEGTLNFNSSLTYKKGGTYNSASAAIEEVDGTSALAVSLPKSEGKDSLINLELPVKPQTGKIYKYTISYNLAADTQENMWLTFASAPTGTQWVNSEKYWIEHPVVNGYGLTPGAGFITGTFAATADKVNETNDTLYFYIKSSGETDRKLYIKSITLEIIKGDFNGDCKIGADDLICMRKALLNDDTSDVNYDINKDNVVNIIDLIRLKKNCFISPDGDSFNGYALVFADDFNGTTLDSGWKLNTFNNDTTMNKFSDGNYSLSNGKLTLSSQPIDDGYYTGTEMFRNDFSFSYGYFEIRAKFAVGGGNQSAFWAKANPSPGYGPEIDVFETFGRDDTITSCFHSWYNNDIAIPGLNTTNAVAKNGKMNIQHIRSGITNMEGSNEQTIDTAATQFHTYGCEWTPEYIKYYIDRKVYCTVDLTKNASEYAILNHEDNDIKLYISHAIVQHSLVEPVNSATQNPSNFVVDYVRLYQGSNSNYIAN